MDRIDNFLAGVKVLEEVESPINRKIRVVKSLGFGTYIQVEGLTQSGGVMYDIWRSALRRVKSSKLKVQSCLILGLGGGDAAKLVRKHWPEAEIIGVEIDPIMIELGKKYLELDKTKAEIVIEDAYKFVSQKSKVKGQKYNLILVDVYVGYNIPDKFKTDKFIKLVKSLLSKDGAVVFNRLYYDEKRKQAEKFHRELIHVFSKVRPIYPKANVMFVCEV